MGNSSSQQRSLNDSNYPQPRRALVKKKSRHPSSDSYSVADGLAKFHSGWRVNSLDQSLGDSRAAELLRRFKIVFVVDDSLPMSEPSKLPEMNCTRWEEVQRALAALADLAAKHDLNGIDIHFVNSKMTGGHENLKSAAAVRSLFARQKLKTSIPIAGKMQNLLTRYLDELDSEADARAHGGKTAASTIKPINFTVITCGKPSDDPEPVVVEAARRLDRGRYPPSQIGIQFAQIGASPTIGGYLSHFDDKVMTLEIRDIFDAFPSFGITIDAERLLDILLRTINRRVHKDSLL